MFLEQATPQAVADYADGQSILDQSLEDRAKSCGPFDKQIAIGPFQAVYGNQVTWRQCPARPP